jgi:hypothetical protein
MRVRTGRFEKLRSGESRDTETIEVGSGHDAVQTQTAVVPPPFGVARDASSQIGVGTQLAESRNTVGP